jgi:endoglucanase
MAPSSRLAGLLSLLMLPIVECLDMAMKENLTPVQKHGMLKVEEGHVVDQHGEQVQLTGMSMFWSQWMGHYWNAEVVNWLIEDFKVNFIRCAMAVGEGGYMTQPENETAKLVAVVDASIAAGIYVMIDWHDHHATNASHTEAAAKFFDDMGAKYGAQPNVLFETFNEPLDTEADDWETALKPYHERMVPIIRKHTENIITLGTRAWSQKVEEACRKPVNGTNLVYTLHFYAQIHQEGLRNAATNALNMGCPLFISEWGTGFEILDLDSSKKWLDWADAHNLSNANWGVYDKKGEMNAALNWPANASAVRGHWTDEELSESGRWVRAYLRGEGTAPVPAPPPLKGCCVGGAGSCECGWCSSLLGRCYTCGGKEDTSVPDTCGATTTPVDDHAPTAMSLAACALAVASAILALP